MTGLRIGAVTLLVKDYDEAIDYFTRRLRFDLIEDSALGGGKRWIVVCPPGAAGATLILAKAATAQQKSRVGDQTGGRVAFFLHTDDFRRDHREMKERGVRFVESPREEAYGIVCVFEDLYGNKWDLIQMKN